MTAAAWFGRLALQLGGLLFLLYAFILFCVPYSPLLGVPLWIAGAWLVTLLHEAGHALAARACGWRVIVFAVRPFALRLVDRNIVFLGLNRRNRQGGWVLSVPARPAVATRSRFAVIVIAGPALCLLLAIVLLATSANPGHGAGLIACGLGILALRSGLFSLLPSAHPGGVSDGANLWRLWRDDGQWATTRPLMWIGAMLAYRVRLRDLPPWMIDAARNGDNPPTLDYDVAAVDIGVVLDSDPVDTVRARRMLDAYRATHGSSEWLDSVDAYFTAMWGNDAKTARAKLWTGARADGLRPMAAAAEAAVAAREGDSMTARAQLAAMHAAVKSASPFRSATYREIGLQIEGLLA